MSAFSRNRRALLVLPLVVLVCFFVAGNFSDPLHAAPESAHAVSNTPSPLAQQGKLIFSFTPRYASKWTGNTLTCTDCHLMDGTVDYASPLIDVANLFPQYNKRAGHRITLQQRIQECFVRSENGKPLPDDSLQMKALVAYIQFLSRNGVKDVPYKGRGLVKLPALTGNATRGRALYGLECAACHQPDGAGIPYAYPPLWGANSFNDGAGMSRVPVLAAFVQHNMPRAHPDTLTSQQAFDIAAYIDSHPRPKFNKAYKDY